LCRVVTHRPQKLEFAATHNHGAAATHYMVIDVKPYRRRSILRRGQLSTRNPKAGSLGDTFPLINGVLAFSNLFAGVPGEAG